MPRRNRHRAFAVALFVVAATAGESRALADCSPASRLSTCIDADSFWPHAGLSRFMTIAATETVAPGHVGFGLVTTYLARPVVLRVPSADPAGAEFEAVKSLWDATFLFSLGLLDRMEANVAIPVTFYRTGVGLSPLTEQRVQPITRTAMRDARLGLALRILRSTPNAPTQPFGLAARFELALPTGDETTFAGDRSVMALPSLSAELRQGSFFGGAEVGARLRQTSELSGSRVGSQVALGIGVGAQLLSDELLGVAIEAFALPTLVGQQRAAYVPATAQRESVGSAPSLVPAEWLLSVRTAGFAGPSWSGSLGAGGALPFFGAGDLTAPSFRLSLSMRYAPVADAPPAIGAAP